MRLVPLAALAVAFLFAFAPAAQAATYVLNADGTVTAQAAPPEKAGCICGPDCKCNPGDCPGGCPVELAAAGPFRSAGDCPNGRCPAPARGRTATASVDVFGYTVGGTVNVPTGPVRGFLGRVRERIQNRPRLLGRGGCASCGG